MSHAVSAGACANVVSPFLFIVDKPTGADTEARCLSWCIFVLVTLDIVVLVASLGAATSLVFLGGTLGVALSGNKR